MTGAAVPTLCVPDAIPGGPVAAAAPVEQEREMAADSRSDVIAAVPDKENGTNKNRQDTVQGKQRRNQQLPMNCDSRSCQNRMESDATPNPSLRQPVVSSVPPPETNHHHHHHQQQQQQQQSGGMAALSDSEIESLLWNEAKYRCRPDHDDASTSPTIATATTAAATADRTKKRGDYISWDDYFAGVAALSALRSKDPDNPQGACLVDRFQRIVGIGYNGFPAGCSDDALPWGANPKNTTNDDDENNNNKNTDSEDDGRDGDDDDKPAEEGHAPLPWLRTKDAFVVHAKVNAILNKSTAGDMAGARLYSTTFPCNECAKVLIQSRVSEIVYCEAPNERCDRIRAGRILLALAGIRTRRYIPQQRCIALRLTKPSPTTADAATSATTTTTSPTTGATTAGSEQNDEDVPTTISTVTTSTSKQSDRLSSFASSSVDDDTPARAGGDAQYDGSSSSLREYLTMTQPRHPNQRTKRCASEVLSWDEYFMAMAHLTAMRSKDPNTQVGACIVNAQRRVVGLGYNGFPEGCSDDHLPWARTSPSNDPLHVKYMYVCHAEVNAVLNKGASDLRGTTIYVALFPCNECAKMIIQAGIAEVVYTSDVYHDTDSCRASRIMFRMAGVKLRQYIPKRSVIRLDLFPSTDDIAQRARDE